jgi:uncharacterized membrane protein YtjA (UPF0391 family)
VRDCRKAFPHVGFFFLSAILHGRGAARCRVSFALENSIMLRLAIVFLVIALVAAFCGFSGVASLSFRGAEILFVIFLILAVLSFLGHGYRRGSFRGR